MTLTVDPSDTDLETVSTCGLCGGSLTPLHPSLTSHVPGPWALSQCAACRSAWLSPRYTPDAIGNAYAADYQPYNAPSLRPPSRSARDRIRRAVADRHLTRKYGYELSRSRLAGLGTRIAPSTRRAADRLVRHAPSPYGGRRLLDIGCSNGAYLALMRQLGWETMGIEPDAGAVDQARNRGLEVRRGTIADLSPETDGAFDYITLGHVLEHIHDPVEALRAVRRVLAPRGALWIATPNLDSLNRLVFGRYWRALDPPRHLVLFNPVSLAALLARLGFSEVRMVRPIASADWHIRESLGVVGMHRGARSIARITGPVVNALSYRRWTLADEMVFVARA
ncbi:MAG TPA: class I SAM-dependent methyltransferase [Solirubrobacteraceae bacterium]|nr:class I SAM-dependent methyltransferase [Solirubrobacteraceae bacterium]